MAAAAATAAHSQWTELDAWLLITFKSHVLMLTPLWLWWLFPRDSTNWNCITLQTTSIWVHCLLLQLICDQKLTESSSTSSHLSGSLSKIINFFHNRRRKAFGVVKPDGRLQWLNKSFSLTSRWCHKLNSKHCRDALPPNTPHRRKQICVHNKSFMPLICFCLK